MIRAYIIGPYRASSWHGIEANIRAAEEVARELWAAGIAAFCPHMNTAHFDGAADDSVFLAGGLVWLECAEVAYLLPGWESSRGSVAEVDFCRARGIRVIDTTPHG